MSDDAEIPEDIVPEGEAQGAEDDILQRSLEEAQKKSADYYDQLLRLKAEFDNYRKRVEREKIEARQWGKQDVLVPLLSLVDIFEQALDQAGKAKDMKQVLVGLEFLHKNFSSFLKTEGLTPLETVGKAFDPHLAEAVEQVEVEDEKAGQVLGEIQRGYSFNGRIIRPARVRVGVGKQPVDIKEKQ